MIELTDDIVHFLLKQHFMVVSTIDEKGFPHNSCKGIVKVDREGRIYLIDLYRQKSYSNLVSNPRLSVAVVDERHFRGYCLKGIGKIVERKDFDKGIEKAWEEKISSRITHRILKNISGEPGHQRHPEAHLPKPAYLIQMDIEEIVDLTPEHIK